MVRSRCAAPGAVSTYNNVRYDDAIKPTITAEINFKQTLATTYNYHCSEQCVPLNIGPVLEVSRARRPSIIDGSFRIARDTIAMIC